MSLPVKNIKNKEMNLREKCKTEQSNFWFIQNKFKSILAARWARLQTICWKKSWDTNLLCFCSSGGSLPCLWTLLYAMVSSQAWVAGLKTLGCFFQLYLKPLCFLPSVKSTGWRRWPCTADESNSKPKEMAEIKTAVQDPVNICKKNPTIKTPKPLWGYGIISSVHAKRIHVGW